MGELNGRHEEKKKRKSQVSASRVEDPKTFEYSNYSEFWNFTFRSCDGIEIVASFYHFTSPQQVASQDAEQYLLVSLGR